ncbi:hypothetical protein [Desulfosarcina sp.]|uniref:hypothetical protein n=1 Tax=Desulfosarcina sp. TaxID=2027861 RepID=UPI0029B8F3CC|nr:hypothetical protein [Desulfosarcina sp.]MDX2454618.1 hypothetical protein [Desulfosarcina sp.]MDX2492239.1 hypothetical protein [Desulfosarcina sp.]
MDAYSQDHDEAILLKNETTMSNTFPFVRIDAPMFLIEVPAALNEALLIGTDDAMVLKNALTLPNRETCGCFDSFVLGFSGRRFLPLCAEVSGSMSSV